MRWIGGVMVATLGCSFSGSSRTDGGQSIDAAVDAPAIDASGDAPFLPGFTRRKSLRIPAGMVDGDLDDFPLLVSLTDDPQLLANAVFPGVRFTEIDGLSELTYELSELNDTGDLIAWVRLPNVAAAKDTWLYLYYDADGLATSASSTNAWEPNFKGVWHLEEDMPGIGTEALYTDATAARNAGTDNTPEARSSGQIGSAANFDNAGARITVPRGTEPWSFANGGLDAGTSAFTISAWIDYADASDVFPSIVAFGAGADNISGYWFTYRREAGLPNSLRLAIGNGTSRSVFHSPANSVMLVNQGWRHVTAVVERDAVEDKVTFYLDGAPIGSEISADIVDESADSARPFAIGAIAPAGDRPWNGAIDEVRVSSVAREAAWIKANFANQSQPNTFVQLGGEEIAP